MLKTVGGSYWTSRAAVDGDSAFADDFCLLCGGGVLHKR